MLDIVIQRIVYFFMLRKNMFSRELKNQFKVAEF